MGSRSKAFLLLLPLLLLLILQAGCGGGTGTVYYGSISGTVLDAVTSAPLVGATVNVEGTSTQTDQNGHYRIDDLETGTKNMTVVKAGYYPISRTVYIARNRVLDEDYSLSTLLSYGQIRIVLTWSGVPEDLDLHLQVPTSDWNSTIGYDIGGVNGGHENSYPFATLSWDEKFGYPEAITIYDRFTQQYYCYVHNFSAETGIIYSEALIEVYDSSGMMSRYAVPSYGSGAYWHVFNISSSGQLIDVNQIQTSASTAAAGVEFNVQTEKPPYRNRRE